MKVFILILLIFIGIAIIEDHKSASQLTSIHEKGQTNRGFIYLNGGSEKDAIASFGNGIVYFRNTDSQYGSYDKDGNIFNQFGDKIGFVSGELCLMDRTNEYERLLNLFSDSDSEYHEECYKPNLIEPAATLWGTWLEPSTTSKYKGNDMYVSRSSESEADNNRGACASYIVATWDGVINDEQHKFYFCVLDDMIKIMKLKKRG